MKTEGNIFTFRVFFDSKGVMSTELSGLPFDEASKVFKNEDLVIVRKVIKECRLKFENFHGYLENEIQALNHHE